MKCLTIMILLSGASLMTACASAPSQHAAVQGASALNGVSAQSQAIGNAAAVAGQLAGMPATASQSPALVGLLVKQLGISPVQALGGAGSIFSAAKQSMSPANFNLLSKSVPGMSQMLGAAPHLTGYPSSGGLLGSAASALGGGNQLGQMAIMANSFQQLGLNAGMVNQFIPVVLQYVQTQGGPSAMSLLQSALLP